MSAAGGFISGGGIYGRHGLEQDEALELLFMSGVLEGFTKAENRVYFEQLMIALKNEIATVERNKELRT